MSETVQEIAVRTYNKHIVPAYGNKPMYWHLWKRAFNLAYCAFKEQQKNGNSETIPNCNTLKFKTFKKIFRKKFKTVLEKHSGDFMDKTTTTIIENEINLLLEPMEIKIYATAASPINPQMILRGETELDDNLF